MARVECDGDQPSAIIVMDGAWDVEQITDDALDAEVCEGRRMSGDSVPAPDGDVVSQLREEYQHFLSSEAALVAMGERETLLVAAVLSFEPAATEIVGVRGSDQHGSMGRPGRLGLTCKTKQRGIVDGYLLNDPG